jgi:hypothetical protein
VSGRRTDYLTIGEILAIHNNLIDGYGGVSGCASFARERVITGTRSRKRLRYGKVFHVSTTSPRDDGAGPTRAM